MPTECGAVVNGRNDEQHRSRDDRNCGDVAGDKYSAQGSDECADEQEVFQMNPPAVVGNAKSLRSLRNEPVEQIDQCAKWAKVAAESAWNQYANGQNGTGETERPNPASGRDRGRYAYERIERQKQFGAELLFGLEVISVMRWLAVGR